MLVTDFVDIHVYRRFLDIIGRETQNVRTLAKMSLVKKLKQKLSLEQEWVRNLKDKIDSICINLKRLF
jgi:hypothetical protein